MYIISCISFPRLIMGFSCLIFIVMALEVNVIPRPFILDRTLRFHQTENEIFKRCIRVFPGQEISVNNTIGGTIHAGMGTTAGLFTTPFGGRRETMNKFIHCPDKNVVVE